MRLKHRIIAAGFAGVGLSGAHRLAAPATRGLGAILMFHHVRPWRPRGYAPNAELEITPECLDGVLRLLKRRRWIVVPLAEAIERVRAGRTDRPFAALTFDDGYRDNREWALPILAREKAPMTLFVTSGFAERRARLWWIEIEEALRRAATIDMRIGGRRFVGALSSDDERQRMATEMLAALRACPQDEIDRVVAELSAANGVDSHGLVDELCLDADEIAELAAHPLVSIGAHTVTHPMLAKIAPERARAEIVESKCWIEARIGRRARHFAYPVGDPTSAGPPEFRMVGEAGFEGAVTTRPGMLFAEHGAHAMALPRLSINGRHQSLRDIDMLLSGLPFALWNGFRRLNVA